jgi:hypothetical protein
MNLWELYAFLALAFVLGMILGMEIVLNNFNNKH